MKKIMLILILSLGMPSALIAGGDDRDQQLPLNSLNTEQILEDDETPRFLEDTEEVTKDEIIQKGQEEIENLLKLNLPIQQPINSKIIDTNLSNNLNLKTKIQLFVNKHIRSEETILFIVIILIIGLIIIFSFTIK
jgi:hypothetical protein